MTRPARILPAAVTVVLMASCLQAGSIWARANAHERNAYADDTAAAVGDVLTIEINERSRIQNGVERSMEKRSARSAKMTGTLDLKNLFGPLKGEVFEFPELDASSSHRATFDGEADYDSDRSVVDQITVTVEDVLPNGNLLVLGRRTRQVEGDAQTIQVSGIVRASDIDFDNTVKSQRVAEFHIVYLSVGREENFTKPGWAARLMNALNPF